MRTAAVSGLTWQSSMALSTEERGRMAMVAVWWCWKGAGAQQRRKRHWLHWCLMRIRPTQHTWGSAVKWWAAGRDHGCSETMAVRWQRGVQRRGHLGAWRMWSLLARWGWASGLIKSLVGHIVPGGLAWLNLFNYSKDFQISNQFKFAKYENGTYVTQKISNLCMLEDKFKRNNFPSGKKFKFPTKCELQIQETNPIWIWFEF
jgi:hypothetical protein